MYMYVINPHTHVYCTCIKCVCITCPCATPLQAVGYGLVLLDGNLVNVNKLQKKLNLSRVDRLFRVGSH